MVRIAERRSVPPHIQPPIAQVPRPILEATMSAPFIAIISIVALRSVVRRRAAVRARAAIRADAVHHSSFIRFGDGIGGALVEMHVLHDDMAGVNWGASSVQLGSLPL